MEFDLKEDLGMIIGIVVCVLVLAYVMYPMFAGL